MRTLILLTAVWMTSLSALATAEDLKVRSVEEQYGKRSEAIEKSLLGNAVDKGTVLNKGADTTHGLKQSAPALVKKRGQTLEQNPDFWIYDAWITFHTDEDFDGYYSHFTVEFDADSAFVQTDVYARLYLSRGDVFEEYHTTSIFTIVGDSSDDSFLVESELLSGFPPHDYELLIELYDPFDDALVATFDGYNDADLTLISLESKDYDVAETSVVVVTESGGSFGYLILLLALLLLRRVRS